MRYFSIRDIICIVLAVVYIVAIIIDIIKKEFKIRNIIPTIGILIIISTITFAVSPLMVVGDSMEPTYENKQFLFLNKFDRDFEINDVIVFRAPKLKKSLIKRIIAKGGDTVSMKSGNVYVNGNLTCENYKTVSTFEDFPEVVVPNGMYFALGDNRPNSLDSRSEAVGFINKKYISGKIIK